jgi:dihydrofolate reductase
MNSKPPRLTVIAAMAENRVIGRDNTLPWRLPADLAYFKRITLGKAIIMGRRTWESLPGILPHRSHIVVSRDRDYRAQGAQVVHSLEEAIQIAGGEEVFIVGGAQLYAQALPLADRLLLTLVHAEIDGDTRFPEFEGLRWRLVGCERHAADERNRYDYSFCEWRRGPAEAG